MITPAGLVPGTRLGVYEVLAQIGEGGPAAARLHDAELWRHHPVVRDARRIG